MRFRQLTLSSCLRNPARTWPFTQWVSRKGCSHLYATLALSEQESHTLDDAPLKTATTSQYVAPCIPSIEITDAGFSAVQRVFVVNNGLSINIDGKPYHFDSIFLRDCCKGRTIKLVYVVNCRCALCVDRDSGQRNFNSAEIPLNIGIAKAIQTSNGSVQIAWSNDLPQYNQQHITVVAPQFLSKMTSRASRTDQFPIRLWSELTLGKLLSSVDFTQYMQDDEVFRTCLNILQQDGLLFLRNVSDREAAVEEIGERIGPLRHTFYGRTWDVRDKPQAENVAYTSSFLGMHMDLLYMKQPPGLQMLHCLRSSCEGGESMFADSFYAADVLWKANPDAFKTLTTFPVSYHYLAAGKSYRDTKPIIELAQLWESDPQVRHGSPQIANINWSPPFQAPFRLDIGLEDFGQKLRQYHVSAKAFASLIDVRARQVRYKMKPGECVIFNNRRILHGRTAFTSGSGERWLKGAYLDTDDFHSRWKSVLKTSPAR